MKKYIFLSAVIICCLNLHAQPGELDSSFGINGLVTTPVYTGAPTSIAVQSDGKVIVANKEFARYNIDGGLDTTFGGGIIKTIDNSIGDLAIQPDGKIVVASRGNGITLSRYNENGTLDAAFDGDGIVNTNLPHPLGDEGTDMTVLIQSDSKIVVTSYYGILRYNANGSLDESFKGGVGFYFYITAAAIQGDGKIVVAGYDYEDGHSNFDVARFNTNGTLDKNFSEDGIQKIDLGYAIPYSVAIQSDGKLLVAGTSLLLRYNSNGNLDNTFSGDGMQKIDFGYAIAIQNDGKIVTAGRSYEGNGSPSKFALARYNTNGILDNTFGSGGKQITELGTESFSINEIAIADNKLYAGGRKAYPEVAVVTRYQLFETKTTTVRISNPTNNQSFTGPATINISAVANAPGGTISKVEFYNGTTLLSADNTYPYSYVWKNVPVGNYTLTAKATDNTGLIVKSPDLHISVVPDKAPIVTITSPDKNRIYRGPTSVVLSADATDGDPDGTISKVEFYNRSTLLYTDNTSPYTYTWENVPVGEYAITAKATDNTGHVTASDVVNFSMRKNMAPAVRITTPANNEIFEEPATISIGVAAKDTDDYIAEAYFYSDTTLIHFTYVENDELDYSYDWSNVPVGDYTLTVKVIDNWGLATTSAPVHVKVIPKRPTVTITSPSDNTIYNESAAIFISAKVTSQDMDGSITKVEFYNRDKLLHKDDSAPFNYTWNNVPVGSYTLIAKTTFSSGLVITSDSVHISVIANKPSPVSISIPSNILVYTGPARIKINANVTDPDSTTKKVEFYYSKGSYRYLLHTEHQYPYGFLWIDVPVGNYTLTAKAIDNSGNATMSNSINVTVVDYNIPPVVSLVSPVDDTTYTGPATIRLIAEAKDPNGRIGKVEFYNGTTLLRTEYYYPYTYTWTNVQPGTYSITAKAYDDKGLSTTSEAVTIIVNSANLPIVRSKPVSENNLNADLSMNLSPVPARNTLQVYMKGLQPGKQSTISVISASGIIMKTIQSNNSNKVVQLDVASLVSGVYTVKVVSGDKVVYKHFVKL